MLKRGSAWRLPSALDHPPFSSASWWQRSLSPDGLVARPAGAKVETWRQEGPSAFAKSHRESVVISDNGRVRLGHAVSPVGSLTAARVWDMARMRDGSLLAATGDSGQVFRRGPKPGDAWNVLYDAADSQVLSLVALPDGTIFAGTGPNGQVVNLSDDKNPASRPDPKVQYIWDLAADPQGNVYAATGPSGQLWKAVARGPMVAHVRRQVDPPALRGDRAGWRRLRQRRRRRIDLSGRSETARRPSSSMHPSRISAPCWSRPTARSMRGRRRRPAARAGRALAFPHAVGICAPMLEGASPDRPVSEASATTSPSSASAAAAVGARRGPRLDGPARGPAAGRGSATPRPISPGDNAVYPDRVGRCAARGTPGQGVDPRAGAGRRSFVGRHGPRGPALRGARPRRGVGPRRQDRQRPDPFAAGGAGRRTPHGHRRPGRRCLRLSGQFARRRPPGLGSPRYPPHQPIRPAELASPPAARHVSVTTFQSPHGAMSASPTRRGPTGPRSSEMPPRPGSPRHRADSSSTA